VARGAGTGICAGVIMISATCGGSKQLGATSESATRSTAGNDGGSNVFWRRSPYRAHRLTWRSLVVGHGREDVADANLQIGYIRCS
jgi:hypothetical protein